MANHSSSPIINGLSDESHPCQLLADIFTIIERTGSIEGKTICWSGYPDNNLLSSYIEASFLFDFKLNIATPFPNLINQKFLKKFDKNVSIFTTLSNAAKSCDALVTDVWQSMGQNLTKDEVEKMKDFQINKEIVECAKKDALIMHCLPMHIGEEISKEASEMKNEAIWQEAENRLHTQKALLITLLKD
jgi:ornithine carbamoyltransferase